MQGAVFDNVPVSARKHLFPKLDNVGAKLPTQSLGDDGLPSFWQHPNESTVL